MLVRDYYGQKLSLGMLVKEKAFPKREGTIIEIDSENSEIKVKVVKEYRTSVTKYVTDYEPSENWQISMIK